MMTKCRRSWRISSATFRRFTEAIDNGFLISAELVIELSKDPEKPWAVLKRLNALRTRLARSLARVPGANSRLYNHTASESISRGTRVQQTSPLLVLMLDSIVMAGSADTTSAQQVQATVHVVVPAPK